MKLLEHQTQRYLRLIRGAVSASFFAVVLIMLAVQDQLLPHRLILVLLLASLETARRRFFQHSWFAVLIAVAACIIAVVEPALRALVLMAPLALASESGYRAAVGLSAASLLILLPSIAELSFHPGSEGILLIAAAGLTGMEYFLQALEDSRSQIRSLRGEIGRIQQDSSQQQLDLERSQLALAARIELAERNRIARRIHDALGHGLTGALWQLRAADSQLMQDVPAARESLRRATEAVETGLEAIRSTIQDLQPREVPDLQLLKQLVTEFDFCPVQLHFEGDPEKIPGAILSVFCDNLRELLTNAMRHSQASEVQIRISNTARFYRMEYRDNGIGMDRSAGESRHRSADKSAGESAGNGRSRSAGESRSQGRGMGLESIHRRCQAIGGSCSFGTAGSSSVGNTNSMPSSPSTPNSSRTSNSSISPVNSATPGFICVCLVSRTTRQPATQPAIQASAQPATQSAAALIIQPAGNGEKS